MLFKSEIDGTCILLAQQRAPSTLNLFEEEIFTGLFGLQTAAAGCRTIRSFASEMGGGWLRDFKTTTQIL